MCIFLSWAHLLEYIQIMLLSSRCFLFFLFFFLGWYELPWFSCEHQINFTSLYLCDVHYFFLFLLCVFHSLWTFGVLVIVASLSLWYFFIFVHVWDRFRLLLFLVLSGFPFFFALCLLPWLLFPPLCCTCWRLTSNMKIGTTAGKYSMCIVLGSFQEGIRPKKDSALIWSQWIHILLLFFFVWHVFFLCFCFFVAAFTLLAPFQLRFNMFISFFMCIFFILYSFHVPCVTSLYFMFPSTFLRVLGTRVAGNTWCWAHLLEYILCALFQAPFKKKP